MEWQDGGKPYCFFLEAPILNGKARVLATCDDKMTLPCQDVKQKTLAGCIFSKGWQRCYMCSANSVIEIRGTQDFFPPPKIFVVPTL